MYTKGLHYGVDFTGGTVLNVKYAEKRSAEDVRRMVTESGEAEASVVALGESGQEFMITSRAPVEKAQIGALSHNLLEKAGPGKMQILSQDVVGPKVGQELKSAALRSLLYTVLLITIYIWFRFDFKFAPGATLAMLHDLAMMTGFYLITGKEFTITAVAALLTIAGYSVNDTIVVYDRVREILNQQGKKSHEQLGVTINHALNITLSRTLLTSGVTLLSVFPIIFFCKGEIGDFALAMAFGIFVGTYSTIYIASPMTIYVEKWLSRKEDKQVGRAKTATA
jgi:preprotein translocase subunit SecF